MENNIINIPEGYEIDKDKSTDRKIVLKAIKPQRPKSWEEYCKMKEGKPSFYYDGYIIYTSKYEGDDVTTTEFDTEDEVKAYVAFGKLLKLRKAWVGDWQPDWADVYTDKNVIETYNDKVCARKYVHRNRPISFPTEEMRDEFYECFKDLLEQAKPLL